MYYTSLESFILFFPIRQETNSSQKTSNENHQI